MISSQTDGMKVFFQIFAASLALMLVVLPGCTDSAPSEAHENSDVAADWRVARPADEFTVALGSTVTLSDLGLTVEFTDVIQESRCPEDVTCITAGKAVIKVEAETAGSGLQTFEPGIPGLVEFPYQNDDTFSIDGFEVILVSLTPYPNLSTPGSEPYTATFRVYRVQP